MTLHGGHHVAFKALLASAAGLVVRHPHASNGPTRNTYVSSLTPPVPAQNRIVASPEDSHFKGVISMNGNAPLRGKPEQRSRLQEKTKHDTVKNSISNVR